MNKSGFAKIYLGFMVFVLVVMSAFMSQVRAEIVAPQIDTVKKLSSMRQNLKYNEFNNSNFGVWKTDKYGLPFFELDFRKETNSWYPFSHFQGSGYNAVLTNRWGDVNLFTTDNGFSNITPSYASTRGGFYPMIKIKDELISLVYSELDNKRPVKYGVGYTEYAGEIKNKGVHLFVSYQIITPFDSTKGFYAGLTVRNLSKGILSANLMVNSDTWVRPKYNRFTEWRKTIADLKNTNGAGLATLLDIDKNFKNIALIGHVTYSGSNSTNTLRLSKQLSLGSNMSEVAFFKLTYNDTINVAQKKLAAFTSEYASETWVKSLSVLNKKKAEDWKQRENKWTYSQLLSMCFYDQSLQEYFVHLGGYGIGTDPAFPHGNFSMREVGETAIVLSYFNPELAKSSLRWMAKTQLESGDLKRGHTYVPLVYEKKEVLTEKNFPDESDTEIWFLIGCGEYVRTTGDYGFLNEMVDFRTINSRGSMWEHMKAGYSFVRNKIGVGEHGLIKMLHGDWNDYLSRIGYNGNGQSLMNTGMMCRALLNMKAIAGKLKDPIESELSAYLTQLQKSVEKSFDKEWFVRAYDDNGKAVGGYNDRLFLNAQSWAALGKCGTPEQRKKALLNAVKHCSTPIGMMLMSRPYSSPTAENISWAPIPAGEGENTGIWPQTVAWMIWALAEEGFTEVAAQEWEKSTLANHTRLHPEVPFGIFNGPDCYSSKFAKEREGWTQTIMFNRMIPIPMNPIIAWQSFGLEVIDRSKGK